MVVDLNTELLTDSIHVVKEPNSMIVDKNQKLWVLCSGGYMNEETPALIRINPADKSIEQVFSFPDKYRSPFSLKTNNSGDSLYFIDNDVFAMSINDAVLPANYIIPEGTHSFYSLAINPHNSHFILTDALDYNQNGKVYRFSPSGSLLKTYTAGIIPGNVCFN
jgi:sugar lactone lactonase YvrE